MGLRPPVLHHPERGGRRRLRRAAGRLDDVPAGDAGRLGPGVPARVSPFAAASADRQAGRRGLAHDRLGDEGRASRTYSRPPEDRISFPRKLAYGMGAFVNNLLAAAIGGMLIILNLGLGMNPALVGLLGAIPARHRCADRSGDGLHLRPHPVAVGTAPAVHLRGRDSLGGSIYATAVAAARAAGARRSTSGTSWSARSSSTWPTPIFATPWVALGYELTPDYHERTRLMGVQNFIGQLAYVVSPWFLWIMTHKPWFADPVDRGAGAGDRDRHRRHGRRHPAGDLPARALQACARESGAGRRGRRESGVGSAQAQHGGVLQGLRHDAALAARS